MARRGPKLRSAGLLIVAAVAVSSTGCIDAKPLDALRLPKHGMGEGAGDGPGENKRTRGRANVV